MTEAEIQKAMTLWNELRGTGQFAKEVEKQIIAPNMDRINKRLGQENDSRYLAYAVEYIFTQASR